jgi:hypothetical protein
MKLVLPLATVGILALLIGPALGQAAVTTTNPHTARAQKVEIVSGGATQSDLHLDWFRTFGNFERDHSAITRELKRDPFLVRSSRFRHQHPEWATFLREHPAIHRDIVANPGDYLVIAPRLVSSSRSERQAKHTVRTVGKSKA